LEQAPAAPEFVMPTTLNTAVTKYLSARSPARGTRAEYRTTLAKWKEWGGGVPIEKLGRKEIRDFLDWVYEHAVRQEGTNPGRTANKARPEQRTLIGFGMVREGTEKSGDESSGSQGEGERGYPTDALCERHSARG